MPGVDFISDLAEEQPELKQPVKKSPLALIIVVIVAAAIIGGGYFGLYSYHQTLKEQERELDRAIAAVESDLKAQAEPLTQALAFQKQLGYFGEIIDQHIYWTKAFKTISNNTLKKVYFGSFSGDQAANQVTLDGVADTYLDAAKQYVAFKDTEGVSAVAISGLQLSAGEEGSGVNFNMVLTLDDSFFQKSGQ